MYYGPSTAEFNLIHLIKFNKMSVWIEMYVNEKYEGKGYFRYS